MDARYSVYRRKDDSPVMIHGTRAECAKAMGIKMKSFDEMASRQLKGKRFGGETKWEIVKDEEGE